MELFHLLIKKLNFATLNYNSRILLSFDISLKWEITSISNIKGENMKRLIQGVDFYGQSMWTLNPSEGGGGGDLFSIFCTFLITRILLIVVNSSLKPIFSYFTRSSFILFISSIEQGYITFYI